MDKIENLQQYEEAEKRVEELLPLVNDSTPIDDPNYIELVHLSNLVADYSDEHFSLIDFDEVLDARHGKVGTPEREQFRKEAEEYLFKVTTAELFQEAVANIPKEVQLETDWSFAISDKIAKVLAQNEMTPKMFAEKVGATEADVSKWLSGTHNFTLRTIARISSVLGENLINI